MRFIAAFMVFACHACSMAYFHADVDAALLPYVFGSGWSGVEFFFILSGFVLTWSARDDDQLRRFWRRRFVKIYPNHLLTWAVAVVLALWAGEAVTTGRVLPSLFLVHTWFPDLTVITSINVPSWSLSCELLFYLSFPLLLRLVRKIRPNRLWLCAGVVAATIMILPLFADYLLPGTPTLPGQHMSLVQNWFLVSFPPVRVLDFTLGILMARIVQTGKWIRLPMSAAVLLLVVGCVFEVLLFPTVYGLTAPVVIPLALVIAAGATADVERKPSLVRGKVMVWLGEISFAMYLVHFLVLKYVHDALGADRTWDTPIAVLIIVGLLGLTIFISWLMYTFVERPSMRRWSRPRSAGPRPGSRTRPAEAAVRAD
ncbi:acyltransferase [Amycolatopsis sp. GM8]|uniref:acyltransferase family protein n=1 Tax=Amycolatopsis sp. GM8 TaxID=2896530 RepID=UPI001F2EAAA2